MGYEALADGELAAVVTYLEMMAPPASGAASPSPLELNLIERPEPERYRELFRLVGSPWLWFSRLLMDDTGLASIIQHPRVEVHAVVDQAGKDVGILELDFREDRQCELAFVGLVPELAGKGHGSWLLSEAVKRGFRAGVKRLHVHTCTLDHPAALSAYRRAGFRAFRRAVERFPDPRLLGILPMNCAPQIPVVGTPDCASA